MFNTAIPVLMTLGGYLSPLVLVPFMASQYKAFDATFKFKSEKASAKSAKALKSASYPPFMILLVGFVATTAFKRYNRRRERDDKEWPD